MQVGTHGRRINRKFVGPALAVVLLLITSMNAAAVGRPAALIIDANTGKVVSANSPDEPRYPASLTKMMTLYVVFDLIEQGKLSYNTRIRFSEAAISVQPTKLGLAVGADIALIDAIKGLIVKSANDAAVAVAEHIAGTEGRFADLMTQKARQIGMAATTFKNAHGLPNSEQVTTARDMITLGLRLQDDFPKHYGLFATRDFRHAGDNHRNHNTMLWNYEGTDGIKTGYTSASGFNLVANVRRGNKHVMGVVFGGLSASTRNQTMRTLLNLALYKASDTKTRVPVAKAKPAPGPKPVARPELVASNSTVPPAKPATIEATPPKPIETARVKTVDIAAMAPAPTTQRPILVAPRPPKQAAIPAVETPPQPAPAPPPQTEPALPIPPLASAATLAPANPASRPAEVRTPNFRASADPSPAPQLKPSFAAPAVRTGAPPSTLQQQAENLARGADQITQQPAAQQRQQLARATATQATPAYRLNGPTAPADTGGNMQIQVGAYASQAEAERQLAAIRGRAGDLLTNRQGVAIPAQSNGRAVFRARYAGFDASSAGTVCTELRRRQIDCMVAKPD